MAYIVLLASLGHLERRSDAAAVYEEFRNRFPEFEIGTFFDTSRWTQLPDRAEIFREGLRMADVSEA